MHYAFSCQGFPDGPFEVYLKSGVRTCPIIVRWVNVFLKGDDLQKAIRLHMQKQQKNLDNKNKHNLPQAGIYGQSSSDMEVVGPEILKFKFGPSVNP